MVVEGVFYPLPFPGRFWLLNSAVAVARRRVSFIVTFNFGNLRVNGALFAL